MNNLQQRGRPGIKGLKKRQKNNNVEKLQNSNCCYIQQEINEAAQREKSKNVVSMKHLIFLCLCLVWKIPNSKHFVVTDVSDLVAK